MWDFSDPDEEDPKQTKATQKKKRIAFVDFWKGFFDNSDRWISQDWFAENLIDVDIVSEYDDPDVIMFSSFGTMHNYFSARGVAKMVFFTGENIRPLLEKAPLCLSFDHIDLPAHIHTRVPLWVFMKDVHTVIQMHAARLHGKFDLTVGHRKGFCSWVASNEDGTGNANVRRDFVQLLSSTYRSVACGGQVLNNVGGPVEDKLAFLKGYKFNIAFENATNPGYCTEKLLHAFAAGCVPIYWGDSCASLHAGNCTDANGEGAQADFNPAAMISAHDFDSFEKLIKHIETVDNDPNLFEAYLRQPIFSERWYKKLCCWPEFQQYFTDLLFQNAAIYKKPQDENIEEDDCGAMYTF